MINRGGDLQVIHDRDVWESPNVGVWIFDSELGNSDPGDLVDEAANLALAKVASLDREALLEEVVAGCPFFTEAASAIGEGTLRLTWRAEPSRPKAIDVA